MSDANTQVPAFELIWDENAESLAIEEAFREILSQTDLSTDLRAEAMTQLARSQGLQGQFEAAKITLKEAFETSQETVPHLRYQLEMGRVLRSSGQLPESAPYFRKAYEEANPLEIARKSDNVRTQGWAAIILNNSAWDVFDEGKYEQALKMFTEATAIRKRALDAKETVKSKRAYRIARWSEGFTLRHMEKNEEAYKIQRQLLDEDDTKPNREELVILCDKLGLVEEAKEHRSILETKFK
ncbi:hypothetical protein BGZ80_008907 [Entomortierella chlamydospora]|uniref:Tetratricopeptide repeat protein n=1 Tax=Entomortierella chlamydospora TaxID=101097 RepID=A0A9P6N7D0_9FUNG|nr:hypothetical protein BGZ80_008907 [Entomortierella chlamydospora]